MKNRIYLNELFDCYYLLLTKTEIKYFTDYYKEDFSLAEIADNNNVSRNAISKTIKTATEKLINYEDKLNILKSKLKILKLLEDKEYEKIKEII